MLGPAGRAGMPSRASVKHIKLLFNARYASTDKAQPEKHYENLHLMPGADLMEIKRSFKKLSKQLHPDMLQSQELTESQKETKKTHYMQIKRSYELLMDPDKKRDYDRRLGVRGAAEQAAKLRTSTGFHYHRPQNFGRAPSMRNDGSHFDSKSHLERNLRNERAMEERKIIMFGDLFRHNLNTRNISYGIHKDVHYRPQYTDEAKQDRKFLSWLFAGFVAIMGTWQLTLGRSGRQKKAADLAKEEEATRIAAEETKKAIEENERRSPSYTNNSYSSMMIQSAVTGKALDEVTPETKPKAEKTSEKTSEKIAETAKTAEEKVTQKSLEEQISTAELKAEMNAEKTTAKATEKKVEAAEKTAVQAEKTVPEKPYSNITINGSSSGGRAVHGQGN